MTQKLENAKNLYLHGIRDGNIDVVSQYSGTRYTQHSTGVKDGVEGFKEFFKDFITRTQKRDIRIIRSIEDENYVFLHVYQNLNDGESQWVTADMFDTDNEDKMIEHWDVISEYIEPQKTISGQDIILGDFEIKNLEKTQENKALIRSFLTEIFQNKNYQDLEKYISTKQYIQHNPNLDNGIEALKDFLSNNHITYDFVFKVIAQGDHVVSYSKIIISGKEYAGFDIFRVDAGKIVEHWDNMEIIGPRSQWGNSGKF